MQMKQGFLFFAAFAVLALMILYTGISCIASWRKAGRQPHLEAGTERFRFSGYYMMAAVSGLLCIFLILVLVLIFKQRSIIC